MKDGPKHFVVGHPRSGTQLLTALLNAGGAKMARHEHLVELSWGALIETATDYYEGRVSADHVARLFDAYWAEPEVLVDANWKLTWILPVVLERFPKARFIHLVRNPHDNVRGCFNLGYYGGELGPGADRAALSRFPAPDGKPIGRYVIDRLCRWYTSLPSIARDDWDTQSPFERNCAFWSETHRLILETLPADRVKRVHLETLQQPERVVELFAFLGQPTPSAAELERVLGVPANPKPLSRLLVASLGARQLPRATEWPASEANALLRLCGTMATTLGCARGPALDP